MEEMLMLSGESSTPTVNAWGHRELIENGGSYTWNTLHLAPIEMHEVELTIHEGQDSVNVDHGIELRYTRVSSEPETRMVG